MEVGQNTRRRRKKGAKTKEEKLRKETEVMIVRGYSRQSRKIAFKRGALELQRGNGSPFYGLI